MSDYTERIGMNEALFREVNERIDQLQGGQAGVDTFSIVCECGATSCMNRFPITNDEYKALRADVHQFAVVPGHERPEVERTVARYDDYLVVVKIDPDAAAVAEETA